MVVLASHANELSVAANRQHEISVSTLQQVSLGCDVGMCRTLSLRIEVIDECVGSLVCKGSDSRTQQTHFGVPTFSCLFTLVKPAENSSSHLMERNAV